MFIRHPALTVVPRPAPVSLRARASRARSRVLARRRQRLAAGYERLVHEADQPVRSLRFSAQVPFLRPAVRALKPELRAIAAALRGTPCPPVAGVRAARELLCDGCGPLYTAGDLAGSVHRVLFLLGPGGPPVAPRDAVSHSQGVPHAAGRHD